MLVALLSAGFVLAWVGGTAAAPRQDLEKELPRQAYLLLKELKKRGHKNVGVLRFRVKKGNKEATFQAGPLSVVMARALENALILLNDEDDPLGIIRQAGQVIADKKERLTYLTAAGREKMFGYRYPLVWGEDEVEADAFVTGLVRVLPGKSTTNVALEVIDRKNSKPEVVSTFEVRTDRTILTDVCQSFVLNHKKIRTAGAAIEDDTPGKRADEMADADAARRDAWEKPTGSEKPVVPERPIRSEFMLVDLEIRYGGVKQEVTLHPMHGGEYWVSEPVKRDKVVFVLTNRGEAKVGVVLAVNGLNTLYQEDVHQGPPELYSRWILEPGKPLEVEGFYQEDNRNYLPFDPLTEEDSEKEEELNPHPRLGAVEMFVLVEGGDGAVRRVERSGLRRVTSSRGRDAREAAVLVRKTTGAKVKPAGFIIPKARALPTRLRSDTLNNPTLQENRVIWYRDRRDVGR